ncbi:MAG: DUF420 domain-containing protein [Planctomycetota bacterium]|nr:MAG: DUF420 domain-containing protein [Planctomycetota bacterium]REJ96244.1 MAG: DUF420 domain-containing protein [Planctomycetota bacterium]
MPIAAFEFSARDFPTVNVSLNALAGVLLVVGFVLIKQRKERAHKIAMLSAFFVSVAFLACYLAYHYTAGHVRFGGPPPISYIYYAILISHVLLAMTVPVLALATIYFGLTDQRLRHRRWARWTFPIWLYVSITGVVVYWMVYWLYPPVVA